MSEKKQTVDEYLDSLPDDRGAQMRRIRKVMLANLASGFQEGMEANMVGYYVPHSIFPAGYHCDPKKPLPFGALANQKNFIAVHLLCVYFNEELDAWFRAKWTEDGRKLDMGKGCLRIKKDADLNEEALGELLQRVTVEKYLDMYQAALATRK
jgi:hypothetical protein